MEYTILTTFEKLEQYIDMAEKMPAQLDELWETLLIQPYWNDIAQWAPFDPIYMKPPVIRSIPPLKQQVTLLKTLEKDLLVSSIQRMTSALPRGDDDPLLIALYPCDDADEFVKSRQNGVVGACVFGNIVLRINPLVPGFVRWIPYVLTHEYHHCVWGHVWYVEKSAARGNLLESLVTEGQADVFAHSLYPDLQASWVTRLPCDVELEYWQQVVPHLQSCEREVINRYMFGEESRGLPWCLGYSLGYHIISAYWDTISFPPIWKNIRGSPFENCFMSLPRTFLLVVSL